MFAEARPRKLRKSSAGARADPHDALEGRSLFRHQGRLSTGRAWSGRLRAIRQREQVIVAYVVEPRFKERYNPNRASPQTLAHTAPLSTSLVARRPFAQRLPKLSAQRSIIENPRRFYLAQYHRNGLRHRRRTSVDRPL